MKELEVEKKKVEELEETITDQLTENAKLKDGLKAEEDGS